MIVQRRAKADHVQAGRADGGESGIHRLNLPAAQREHYSNQGSLAISASGHELLLGLTPEDSAYVVACSAMPPDALSDAQRLRHAALLVKHEKARLRGLAFAGRAKNESALG